MRTKFRGNRTNIAEADDPPYKRDPRCKMVGPNQYELCFDGRSEVLTMATKTGGALMVGEPGQDPEEFADNTKMTVRKPRGLRFARPAFDIKEVR